MPSDAARPRRSGPPRRVRVYRVLFVIAALSLLIAGLYGRCQLLQRSKSADVEEGLVALSLALDSPQSDYAAAEEAFQRAARQAVADPYPRFCLSVVSELRGRWPLDVAAPAGWSDAVSLLAANDLVQARAWFAATAQTGHPTAARAALFVRLIDDLRRVSDPHE